MIPDSFKYYNTPSYGEKKIYEALKNKLDDSWMVCHSWRWVKNPSVPVRKNSQGEGDFIVFHPDCGIIVIEVKGGSIEFRNNGKYYTNGNQIQNPEEQAARTKYEIINKLKLKKLDKICWVYHCVWFPDIEWNISYPPNLNEEILLDLNALANPEKAFRNLSRNSSTITNEKVKEEIKKILHSPFKIARNLLVRMNETDELYYELTSEQENICRSLRENSIFRVKGRAGTGKTFVALHLAHLYSESGKKVLYLCSNRGLADFLENQLKNEVTVSTFYRYARDFLFTHYPTRIPIDFNEETDFNYIIDSFSEVADENLDKFDVCIIDEAQDLKPEFFENIRNAYIDKGNFIYFYDPLQIAYSRNIKISDPFENYHDFVFILNRNLRNPLEIGRAALNIIDADYSTNSDFSLSIGESPTVYLFKEEIENEVKKTINDLIINQKVPSRSISILSMKGMGKSICGPLINEIEVTTFRKFKGLDNRFIILIDVTYQHFIDEVYKRELYMAITRSRFALYLFIDDNEHPMKKEFCNKNGISVPTAEIIKNLLMENRYE